MPSDSPEPETFPPDEPPTLVVCVVCAGKWSREYRTQYGTCSLSCPWCTEGSMTPKQVAMWAQEQAR